MPGAIVYEMTALAEGTQIAQAVVARVMIQMGSGQHHLGFAHLDQIKEIRTASLTPFGIPPVSRVHIEPATRSHHPDPLAMRTATNLAPSLRSFKPYVSADL
ncbi:hypothetical protein AA18889_2610 [Acetobacter senegalensis DSM 18889]|nr:hypothetical protein AA18889_2610 [Acetobacter senegalensis DSM 18889]